MTGQSVGSDANPLSCFSSAQAPYRSFPPKAAKTHSFRCVSSSHRTRFAGLRREPCFPPITAQSAEAMSHTAWESPFRSGFKSHSHKRLTFVFTGESGYTLAFTNRIAHRGLHGETRGVLDGGAITTLGAFCAVRKPCVAGCQNGKLCRFWALVGCVPKERREPAEQRCAYACRCPEASRPHWAA